MLDTAQSTPPTDFETYTDTCSSLTGGVFDGLAPEGGLAGGSGDVTSVPPDKIPASWL